mmetsp:Transcript_1170/g.7605  ORF Transcript_1170/g.7605 Transcript_1170/m.7605 type:complete len:83 (+) Transcript_1170:491-739(+)
MADEDGSSGSSGLRRNTNRANFDDAYASHRSQPLRNNLRHESQRSAGKVASTQGYGIEYIRGKGGVAKYRDCAYSDCVRKPS